MSSLLSRPKRATRAGLVVAALLLAGCTGIPVSSSPQVIETGGLETPNPLPIPPPSGAQPREIVQDFLTANADIGDQNHTDARQYLTPSERARWSDATVTVLGPYIVGAPDRNQAVTVDGPVLGQIDASGAYTPQPLGDGDGQANTFTFQTKLVAVPHYARPQWRIDKVPTGAGLLVSSQAFQLEFQQRTIYYFDSAEQHLVPEPHYTQLLDPGALATWLIRIFAAGPPESLEGELPADTDPSRVSVAVPDKSASPVQVVIPGASQLDPQTQKRLATEVAATLSQVSSIGQDREITILDGTAPVTVSGLGTTFTAQDFTTMISPVTPHPELYYIDPGGGVVDAAGHPLPGRVGSGYYDLNSVALASDPNAEGLLVAGTRIDHGVEALDIGRESTGLQPVPKLTGELTRPDWAPDVREVWIGDGSKLYRVSQTGHATVVPMVAASGQAAGRIVAVRLSPEGSRVAIVLDGTDAEGHPADQIWIGVVSRSNGVRVEGLTPITPTGVVITDVGWNDALKLFAIGHDRETGDPGVYEVQCDGSRWSARGIGILPGPGPDSITVGDGQVAVVSAANTIWEQNAGSWRSPQGEQTDGRAPIYVQ